MEIETINVNVETKKKFGGPQIGGGRPTKMTPDVIAKLIEGFKHDFTDTECCLYAGIDQATYYRYKKKNKGFAREIEAAKTFPFLLAKRNIIKAMHKESSDDSWKFLSKRQKELYSDRIENTGANGKDLEGTKITINSFTKNEIVNMDTTDLLGAMDQLALEE